MADSDRPTSNHPPEKIQAPSQPENLSTKHLLDNLHQELLSILKNLAAELDADLATLFLYDASRQVFDFPVGYGIRDQLTFSDQRMRPRRDRVAGKIVRDRQPIVANRVKENPAMDGPFARREGIKSAAGIPILSRQDEPLGVLFISYRQEHHDFETVDLKKMQRAALASARAIQSTDIFEVLSSIRARPEADVDRSLESIVSLACNVLDLPVSIWLLDSDLEHLHIEASTGIPYSYAKRASVRLGDGSHIDQVFRQARPLSIEDLLQDDRFSFKQDARSAGWSSALAYPIQRHAVTLGVIEAFSFDTKNFDSEAFDTLYYLTDMIGVALENARRTAEARKLAETIQSLSSTPDFDRSIQVIVENARAFTAADLSAIYLHNGSTGEYSMGYFSPSTGNLGPDLLAAEHRLTNLIASGDRLVHITDTSVDARVSGDYLREAAISLLGVPLRVAGERIGVLYLLAGRRDHFTAYDIRFVRTLADQVLAALGWSQLLLKPSQEFEKDLSHLFHLEDALERITADIQDQLGFDFVAVQLIRPEEQIVETVYGTGIAADWVGRARHYLEQDPSLRDIQADIILSPKIEIISGKDPRFDDWVYEEYQHERLIRIFAPIYLITDDRGELVTDWREYFELQVDSDDRSGQDQHTVLSVDLSRLPGIESISVDAIGTIEAGFTSRKKQIDVELAAGLISIISQQVIHIHKTQLPFALKSLARHARKIMHADSASLHFNPRNEGKKYIYEVCVGDVTTEFLKQHPPRRDGLGWQAILEGRRKFVPDAAEGHHASYLEQFNSGVFRQGIRSMVAFPIIVGAQRGVLYLHLKKEHQFSQNELDWVQQFVTRASNTIYQATLYLRMRDRARHLATLRSITESLSRSPEGSDLLNHIAWNTLNLLSADIVTIYEYTEFEEHFSTPPVIAGKLSAEPFMTTEIKPHDAPARLVQGRKNVYAVRSSRHRIMNDPDRPRPTDKRSFVERESVMSSAGTLLKVGAEIVGVMFINYRRQHAFAEDEKQIIETLASSAAIAIKNRRLLHTLSTIDREIVTTLDLEKLIKLIVRRAVQLTDADVGDIRFFDPIREVLIIQARIPESEMVDQQFAHMPIGEGITGWVASHKQSVLVDDVRKDDRFKAYFRGTLSELCVPLLDKDRQLLGVLNMESRDPGDFDQKDQRALEALANQAVIAILNARKQKDLIASETMATLGDLAAPLVHRMNKEIGFIKKRLSDILERLEDDVSKMHAIKILSLASDMLNEVQDLNRWIVEKPQVVDLSKALSLARQRVGIPEHVDTNLHMPPGLPSVMGGSHQLIDVFCNLIQNAVDAMDDRGKLTITAEEIRKPDACFCVVSFTDTGEGIAEENLEKIFERKFSTKREKRGLGFGLWWARSYVERLGGRLLVESTPGQGSKFTLILPCV